MKNAIILLLLINIAAFAQQKGSFTDSRDGKNYKTVKIGAQTWMAENLNYNAADSKCYEDKQQNCNKYGRLYNWNTARKNACPSGWHLPTDEEWEELYVYIDSISGKTITRPKNKRYFSTEGASLKTVSGWNDDAYSKKSGNGTDKYGFSALPGGSYYMKKFQFVGTHSYWWTASKEAVPHNRYIANDHRNADYGGGDEDNLHSVRCLLNSSVPASFPKMVKAKDITDSRDGQKYKTVKIGGQIWMAENLNYNAANSECYKDEPQNCDKYGRLYNLETATKACPSGWHLPTNEEWDKLYRYADGDSGKESPYNSKTAGALLKAVKGWESPGGTDEYGFSALPGGYGGSKNRFGEIGFKGFWWSASVANKPWPLNSDGSTHLSMYYDSKKADYGHLFKSMLHSVRCVKNF